MTMHLNYVVHLHYYLPSYQKLVNYRKKSILWSFRMPRSVQLLYGFSVSRQVCQVASRLILERAPAFCSGGVDPKVRPACAAVGEQQTQVYRYSSHPLTSYGHWSACDTDQQVGKLCSSNASQPSGGGCQGAVRLQHTEQGSALRAQSSAAALLLCLASCCVVAELHASCAQS